MGVFYVGNDDLVRPVPWLVGFEVGQAALGVIGVREEDQDGKRSGNPETKFKDPPGPPFCRDSSIGHLDTLRVGPLRTLTSLLPSQYSNLNLKCLYTAFEILTPLIRSLTLVAVQTVSKRPHVDGGTV